jgi:hypothetical protein
MNKSVAVLLSIITVALISVLLIVRDTGAQTTGEGQLKPGVNGSLFQNVAIDCLDVKFKLTKVHEEDGLQRVNAGQLYEAVSTKLMARLGSRIVQNRLDGAELIKKASEYEIALNNFRTDYRMYEVAMSSLIKSDCSTQPMIFYNSLQNVRDLRSKVNTDTKQLTRITKEYYDAFLNFSERVKQEKEKK